MSTYLALKLLHLISATVLFGTGIGIAWFKWSADRSGDTAVIRGVAERVVAADWLFTTPAAVIQPLSGLALALHAGYPLTSFWLTGAFVLYAAAGICWLRVLRLQIVMRDLAVAAEARGEALDPRYLRCAREWYWLGVAAFAMFVVIFFLMVTRPG